MQSPGVGRLVPPLALAPTFGHRDDIEFSAAPDRVMHEMGAGPEPEPDNGRIEGRGRTLARHKRAGRRRAGKTQRSIGSNALADHRPQAVGADQARSAHPAAVGRLRGDGDLVFRNCGDLEAGRKRDLVELPGDGEERGMQVGAVQREIRGAVAGFGMVAERN